MKKGKLSVAPLTDWYKNDRPLIAAGPCGAESEKQVLDTARFLKETGNVTVFRAGVWKPRTRPGSFEGKGEEALGWLKTVKEETGLLTAVEVANTDHVEKALKAGVDVFWIGARTTVNPFYVQDIASALRGTDVIVWVKNPLHADSDLWIGALERLNACGINKLAAIHRGWYNAVPKPYRNDPRWELAVEMRLRCPGLPILSDPSHISGTRDLIPSVAQHALDLDMDGLMIEVHPTPSEALSDAGQQLSFSQFSELMDTLKTRRPDCPDRETASLLQQLRAKVDSIDEQLLSVLASRMELIKELGIYKKENNVAVFQPERWREIVKSRLAIAKAKELDQDFIYELLQVIHKNSLNFQTEMMKQQEEPGEVN